MDSILKQAGQIDIIVIELGGVANERGGIAADHLAKASGGSAYGKAARKTAEAASPLIEL